MGLRKFIDKKEIIQGKNKYKQNIINSPHPISTDRREWRDLMDINSQRRSKYLKKNPEKIQGKNKLQAKQTSEISRLIAFARDGIYFV